MPGAHKKGPISSERGFEVGKKTSKIEVIDKDAYVKSDRIPDSILRVKKVEVSNAAIKAAHTTNIELVEAPGAGKMLHIESVVLRLNHGGTNHFTGDRSLTLGIDDGTRHAFGAIAHGNFHQNTASHVYHAQPAIASNSTAAQVENKNFAILPSGAIAQVASDNTFTVWVAYRVLTV